MLFSNPAVASYINEHFEPAWQSVREVPLVHIELGGGVLVTRTLHGNIATYVCNADGHVLDILPGIYDASTYVAQLGQLRMLDGRIAQSEDPLEELAAYHVERLARPNDFEPTQTGKNTQRRQTNQPLADFSKVAIIERPVEAALETPAQPPNVHPANTTLDSTDARTEGLARDSHYNERYRRRVIHQRLASASWTVPQSLTKWLYREVLDTDLDDPYLGLRPLLEGDELFTDRAISTGQIKGVRTH